MCDNCEHKPVCSIYRATGGVKSCEHHKEEREEARAKRHREWMEKKKAQRMRTVICAYCGREFQTNDSRKKYCRPDCFRRGRQEAWREREERRKKGRQ